MTTTAPVHWHEGMFLTPQHFQAHERHTEIEHRRQTHWTQHHSWGLKKIEIDEDALANYRLVIRSMEARLSDGTSIDIPSDAVLPTFDLKEALSVAETLTIHVALPIRRSMRPVSSDDPASATARYLVDTVTLEDENTGVNPQPVQIRHLNVRLLHSNQDMTGYQTLPVVKLRRADRAESLPQIDESYIPPVLCTNAWKSLDAGIMQRIYDRLGKKVELLSNQIVSRNISFDSQGQGDQLLLEQLRALNESLQPLAMAAFTPGIHPTTAYLELSRVVGKLAIFGATRRPPELPLYDHDDLGNCFWRVKQQIDDLLDSVVEPQYKERQFVGAGLRMQVDMEPSWLEGRNQLFIGVQSQLPAEEVDRLLSGGLDMKVGSSERVCDLYRLGQAGLRFTYASHPPRALPAKRGLSYFAVDRDLQREEWERVKHSLTLAIRLNENLIVSDIQGQRTLSIRIGGQTSTLAFTLYVVGGND